MNTASRQHWPSVRAADSDPRVADTPAASLSATPSCCTLAVGATLEVAVVAKEIVDLYGFNFSICYDPDLVSVLQVREGDCLQVAGATSFAPGAIDATGGVISTIGATLRGQCMGASGSGVLAWLTLQGLARGTSCLAFTDLLFLDSQLRNLDVVATTDSIDVLPVPPKERRASLRRAGHAVSGLLRRKLTSH